MLATTIRRFIFSALIASCAPLAVGCYAEADAPEAYDGYQPIYHDGYVVYYDNVGAPYYYVGGRSVYIDRSSPYYGGYVAHYRTYGARYNGWYARQGYRYRSYRGYRR